MDEKILDEIKLYARIDEDYNEIPTFISAAEEYLNNAGITKNYNSDLYNLCIKMLVKHWYDNREITTNKPIEIPYGITCIINQLQINNLGSVNATK